MRFLALLISATVWSLPAHAIRIDFEEPGLGVVNGIAQDEVSGLDTRGFHFGTNMAVLDISVGSAWEQHGPARSGLFALLNSRGGGAVMMKSDASTFTFQHLYIRPWLTEEIGETFTVRGFLGGDQVGAVAGTIVEDWWTLVDGDFDSVAIDRLVLEGSHFSFGFMLDDIRVDGLNDPPDEPVLRPAPEPSTLSVFFSALLGILVIGFVRARRES